MVIWCISKYACPPKYGAGARLFNLAKEFNESRHEAIIITSDSNHLAKFPETSDRYNLEQIQGVPVHWIKTIKYQKTASLKRILSWFDFEIGLFRLNRKHLKKPDVLIVSSLSLLSIVYGYYLKKRYKAFLILEIRDIWPLTLTEEGGFNKWHPLSLFMGFIERFGYRKADLIVGTMPRLDLHVKEVIGRDRPFYCSPLGFDKSKGDHDNLAVDDEISAHFPKDKIIVGYAGSMGTTNALEPFMQCIEESESVPDIHFVVVGAGDLRDKFVKQLSHNTNVTFVPKISPNQVPVFLNYCDILYLSTHNSMVWKFGQSMNKVVEYMLAGKPIIASYSGHPSMINEADSGAFVPANDFATLKAELLKFTAFSKDEQQAIGKKGREWVLVNRSYSKLAEEYLEKINSMIIQC